MTQRWQVEGGEPEVDAEVPISVPRRRLPEPLGQRRVPIGRARCRWGMAVVYRSRIRRSAGLQGVCDAEGLASPGVVHSSRKVVGQAESPREKGSRRRRRGGGQRPAGPSAMMTLAGRGSG